MVIRSLKTYSTPREKFRKLDYSKLFISKSTLLISLIIGVRIKAQDIRALPDSTLKSKLEELNLELGIERRKIAATGVASKVVKTREIKKTIARIKTILKERGVSV